MRNIIYNGIYFKKPEYSWSFSCLKDINNETFHLGSGIYASLLDDKYVFQVTGLDSWNHWQDMYTGHRRELPDTHLDISRGCALAKVPKVRFISYGADSLATNLKEAVQSKEPKPRGIAVAKSDICENVKLVRNEDRFPIFSQVKGELDILKEGELYIRVNPQETLDFTLSLSKLPKEIELIYSDGSEVYMDVVDYRKLDLRAQLLNGYYLGGTISKEVLQYKGDMTAFQDLGGIFSTDITAEDFNAKLNESTESTVFANVDCTQVVILPYKVYTPGNRGVDYSGLNVEPSELLRADGLTYAYSSFFIYSDFPKYLKTTVIRYPRQDKTPSVYAGADCNLDDWIEYDPKKMKGKICGVADLAMFHDATREFLAVEKKNIVSLADIKYKPLASLSHIAKEDILKFNELKLLEEEGKYDTYTGASLTKLFKDNTKLGFLRTIFDTNNPKALATHLVNLLSFTDNAYVANTLFLEKGFDNMGYFSKYAEGLRQLTEHNKEGKVFSSIFTHKVRRTKKLEDFMNSLKSRRNQYTDGEWVGNLLKAVEVAQTMRTQIKKARLISAL